MGNDDPNNSLNSNGDKENNVGAKHSLNSPTRVLPWYKTPSTIINISAVIVTLTIGASTIIYDNFINEWAKRQSRNEKIEKLTNLSFKLADLTGKNLSKEQLEHANGSLINQRLILLDLLEEEVDGNQDKLSKYEIGAIGYGYLYSGKYEKAKDYFNLYLKRSESVIEKASAYSTLANLYLISGTRDNEEVLEIYDKIIDITKGRKDLLSQNASVDAYVRKGRTELASQNYSSAMESFFEALKHATELPCFDNRKYILEHINSFMVLIAQNKPMLSEMILEKTKSIPIGDCPYDPPINVTTKSIHNNNATNFNSSNDGIISKIAGNYLNRDNNVTLSITVSTGGKLSCKTSNGDSFLLINFHDLIFTVEGAPSFIFAFKDNDNNEVNGFVAIQPNGIFIVDKV